MCVEHCARLQGAPCGCQPSFSAAFTFSTSEPRSWLSIILYSSIVSICLSSESARPWSRRKQPYFRNQPSRFAAWRFLLCSLTTNRPFPLIRHDRTCSSVDFGRIAVAPSDLEYNQGRDHRISP